MRFSSFNHQICVVVSAPHYSLWSIILYRKYTNTHTQKAKHQKQRQMSVKYKQVARTHTNQPLINMHQAKFTGSTSASVQSAEFSRTSTNKSRCFSFPALLPLFPVSLESLYTSQKVYPAAEFVTLLLVLGKERLIHKRSRSRK